MKNVYENAFKPEHALKGFEACGIFPLNREKITDEKLKIGKIFSKKRTEQEEDIINRRKISCNTKTI
jgi:hypothetical protein